MPSVLSRSYVLAVTRPPAAPTLFPYTTLFRSARVQPATVCSHHDHAAQQAIGDAAQHDRRAAAAATRRVGPRSEEHTSELQSPCNHVCRLLLDNKNLMGDDHDDYSELFAQNAT